MKQKSIFSEIKEAKEITIKRIGKVEIHTKWDYTVFAKVICGEDEDRIIFIEQASYKNKFKLKVGVLVNNLIFTVIIPAKDVVNIIK